jgi:hypothetical protein
VHELGTRDRRESTLPSTGGEVRAIDPLLRSDELAVERNAGRAFVDRVVVFVEIRARKTRVEGGCSTGSRLDGLP